MTNNLSAAKRYREEVRPRDFSKASQEFPDLKNDINLYSFFESEYEKEKIRLLQLITEEESEDVIRAKRSFVFILSVGLFTFGRLNVYQDILDNIPHGLVRWKGLSSVITTLLPTPAHLEPLKNPDEIAEWIKIKYSKLKWDESLEKYILENFRILPTLPANSTPKKFIATDHKSQEELFVEIIPDSGINWIASFQPGFSDFSGIYSHPNRIDLIIISKGQAYIVNPENQNIIDTFGGNITSTIEGIDKYVKQSYPEKRIKSPFILFVNNSYLICYDEFGFVWQNIEILWNNVRETKFYSGIVLIGEFFSNEESWMPFWLDIKTGEFHREEFSNEKFFTKKTERPWWQFW